MQMEGAEVRRVRCWSRQQFSADSCRRAHLAGLRVLNRNVLAGWATVGIGRVGGDAFAVTGAEMLNLADKIAAVVVGFHAISFEK